MIRMQYNLGNFEMESGTCFVTDPLYDVGTWCQRKLENVKKGIWFVHLIIQKEANKKMYIEKMIAQYSNLVSRKETDKIQFEIGLDNGQAGIFDCKYYKNKNKKWYEKCRNITVSSKQAGIIPFGVVSYVSALDGYFKCEAIYNQDGEIVEISIDFIQETDTDIEVC